MIKPLGDRAVIRPLIAESKTTESGIFIPKQDAKSSYLQGEVISIGSGRILEDGRPIPLEILPGDIVLYKNNVGISVKRRNEEFIILHEDDIVAVLNRKDD